eukprot:4070785-Pyramimonas_sp.AAC.1
MPAPVDSPNSPRGPAASAMLVVATNPRPVPTRPTHCPAVFADNDGSCRLSQAGPYWPDCRVQLCRQIQ